jgi:hypothetical protein
MLVIPDAERAARGVEAQRQLAAGQHRAIMRAEDRQQHLGAKLTALRRPVDVEEVGVERALARLEHVEPPVIVGLADAHVVGHEIEHEAHAARPQRIGEAHEIVPGADLGVDRIVIGDVVTVLAARPRLQERRGIDVADAE